MVCRSDGCWPPGKHYLRAGVDGSLSSATEIHTAGLVECEPPEQYRRCLVDAAAQTEAVLMREEFSTVTRETREDPSGARTLRETESIGIREPGDIWWRTWNRDTMGGE